MTYHRLCDRIRALRAFMKENHLGAFIIPSTDPHASEYVAPHWASRQWISGFTGSAGTVVVTLEKAGLWTDSRYFLQATAQLEGTGIELYKEMLPETPSISRFLTDNLAEGSFVGIDGQVFTISAAEDLEEKLAKKGIRLRYDLDPMETIWEDRPPVPQNPAYIYDLKYAGKSCREKIEEIRKELREMDCRNIFLSALDEIAWTLNLRGSDVKCNPVVVSYLLITEKDAVFFIDPAKLTAEVREYLAANGITLKDYEQIFDYLNNRSLLSVLLTPEKTNYAILQELSFAEEIIRKPSPVALLKAIRNETELEGLRLAMVKDGRAMVKFLKWLEENVPSGTVTELSASRQLYAFRAQEELFVGESFDTIAGYGEHGAIVHYEATPETDVTLQPHGLFLIDSGAQYLDGTTDITRTIALGELTEEERMDYTLVLKGHIALASARFPAGTRGCQLDVLARLPMWKQGINYLHGTGHGVGHFLNVHEGPQSIRMNENPVTLRPGMVVSNEPGIYKAGSHGVRTENLLLVVKDGEGMYGDYYRFETLTLCPIDRKGVVWEMMSGEEVEWLERYERSLQHLLQ